METTRETSHLYLRIALLVLASLLFAGAYCQSPLFSSNQNTYFLSGLAGSGFGHLSSDWLAQQTDGVPVFSALVALIHSHGSDWMFYGLHGVLAAVYVLSLYFIANRTFPSTSGVLSSSLFFALITLLHFPFWRVITKLTSVAELFTAGTAGHSIPVPFLQPSAFGVELFTHGMAEQYILGPFLQPSAFGVLLIASISFFICRKELMAVVCAVLAATFHPTYMLHAAMLTGAYLVILFSERNARRALAIGAIALLLILPIVLYVLLVLRPTSSSVLAQAQAILVEERIPHHAKVSVWFSRSACIQLGIILGGLVVARRCKRLFSVLVFCAIGAVLLTCVQIISRNRSLALLFPWRVSAWLVPISSAVVIGFVSVTAANIIQIIPVERIKRGVGTLLVLLSSMLLCGAFVLGLHVTVAGAHIDRDRASVILYAKTHSGPDQTYLVPLKYVRFRLGAGVPIFVDWKSHPCRDIEVVEWYERVQLAKAFYRAKDADAVSAALADIQKLARITHVVVEKRGPTLPLPANCRLVYEGQDGFVYELMDGKAERM
jgi:hypothetical protein